jgi:ABC-type nickel/cobalt efflux system permease component RcnA
VVRGLDENCEACVAVLGDARTTIGSELDFGWSRINYGALQAMREGVACARALHTRHTDTGVATFRDATVNTPHLLLDYVMTVTPYALLDDTITMCFQVNTACLRWRRRGQARGKRALTLLLVHKHSHKHRHTHKHTPKHTPKPTRTHTHTHTCTQVTLPLWLLFLAMAVQSVTP